jgi:protein TonB
MGIKKSPKVDLEKGKGFILFMGVIAGLVILFVGFELGMSDFVVAADQGVIDFTMEEEIEIAKEEDTPLPSPRPLPPPARADTDVPDIVEDDIIIAAADLLSTEDSANQSQAQTQAQAQIQVQTYAPPAVADNTEDKVAADNEIFVIVEEMPEFPGGMGELLSFIYKSIRYPVVAQENGIQGRVTCAFVINKDGSIVDAEVIRGVNASLDKEALRVINSMPKWKPGRQRGKEVRIKYHVPINFRLQNYSK